MEFLSRNVGTKKVVKAFRRGGSRVLLYYIATIYPIDGWQCLHRLLNWLTCPFYFDSSCSFYRMLHYGKMTELLFCRAFHYFIAGCELIISNNAINSNLKLISPKLDISFLFSSQTVSSAKHKFIALLLYIISPSDAQRREIKSSFLPRPSQGAFYCVFITDHFYFLLRCAI